MRYIGQINDMGNIKNFEDFSNGAVSGIEENAISDINKAFGSFDATKGKILKALSYLVQGRDAEALSFMGNNQIAIGALKSYINQIKGSQMTLLKSKKDDDIQNYFKPSADAIIAWLKGSGSIK